MEFIKKIIRFFYYKNERNRIKRERKIKKNQNTIFRKNYDTSISKLIVFLVDGADWNTGTDLISGGILSIASIYEETQKLNSIHHSKVIMATLPKTFLLEKHTQFPNKIDVYRFNQLKQFKNLNNLLVHVPEYRFNKKVVNETSEIFSYLKPDKIHFNILNQRLDLMPNPLEICDIHNKGYKLTQTTAHERYSTKEIWHKFGIPLHKLSVYATPNRYNFKKYKEKENLILVSPDEHTSKNDILKLIEKEFPDFKIEIIQNLTYLEYLEKIERAKFMITFGEGLDFYFIETVFSGGISFAVYNNVFFTEIFEGLTAISSSYGSMKNNIVASLKKFDNNKTFVKVNAEQFKAVNSIYNDKFYKENLRNFYCQNYLFK